VEKDIQVTVKSSFGREINLILRLYLKGNSADLVRIFISSWMQINEQLEELVIPATLENYKIKRICMDVFEHMGNNRDSIISELHPLKRLVIDDNISTIQQRAFIGAYIGTLVWPKSCHTIQESTFKGAFIEHYEGMEDVTEIKQNAFRNNFVLKSFDFPKGCTKVPANCFEGCERMSYITGLENVTEIGEEAFTDCRALEEFDWPAGCSEIPDMCFFRNINLSELKISSPVTRIGRSALNETALKEINLSESLICDVDDTIKDSNIFLKLPFYMQA
jgi:hypothetical protein